MSLERFGEIRDGVLILHPIFTATHFENQVLENIVFSTNHLIINGEKVERCDSVGIAALLWLLQQATSKNITLNWQNLPIVVTRLLDLYELDFKKLVEYTNTTY